MALQFTIFDQTAPQRAGSGPNSRRTLISCVPRVCMSYTPKGIDLNLPRNEYMALDKWVNALHMQTGNRTQAAYYYKSMVIQNQHPEDDRNSVGSLLLALTITKSRVRAVGSRMSKAEKATVFLRAVDNTLLGLPFILRFTPATGTTFNLFSGSGFIVPSESVLNLMPLMGEKHLTSVFGNVLSDATDFMDFGITLHRMTDLSPGEMLHEDEWGPFMLSPDDLIVSEYGNRESVVVADRTPKRKRKLLFKRK